MRRHRRRLRAWGRRQRRRRAFGNTLADVCPGDQVRIVDLNGLPESSRVKLQALGLCPGRCVEVIRHSPVTMVRAEHSELALEVETAEQIMVETDSTCESSKENPCEDPDPG